MQRQILMRSFVVALVALLTLALPASTVEPGAVDTDSPLVDILMSDGMTREEMVGLYGALAGGGFEPPDCVPGDEMFDDVPASNIFCPWIEELARSGITSGCDADNYCPGDPVSRARRRGGGHLRQTDDWQTGKREVGAYSSSPATRGSSAANGARVATSSVKSLRA